jgi:histone chaperone ASF1
MVGPVPSGINRFVLQTSPPNPDLIGNQNLLGVTVILITCSYKEQKFIQIGYYVSNEYSEEYDVENPPPIFDVNKIFRTTLYDQPRVTRFNIDWTGQMAALPETNNVTNNETLIETDEALDLTTDDAVDQNETDDADDDDDDEEEDGDEVNLEDVELQEADNIDIAEDGEFDEFENMEIINNNNNENVEIQNGDSNSMDIERMLQ